MKRLLSFFACCVALFGQNNALAQSQASNSASCVGLSTPVIKPVAGYTDLWDVTVNYNNPNGQDRSLEFSCDNCTPVCKEITDSNGTVTARLQCANSADIKVQPYNAPSCAFHCECYSQSFPVSLLNFDAVREERTVILKWQTASESNNLGWYIDRNINDVWQEEVPLVPTEATDGNSTLLLNYRFTDNNSAKGITAYRLRQVNLDGTFAYSPTTTVLGDGQAAATIVYPNPSSNGSVNVFFANGSISYSVVVYTVTGQLQYESKDARNTLRITDLPRGVYFIKAKSADNKEETVKKVTVD